MSSDLVDIFLLSLVAMFNPTLLAAARNEAPGNLSTAPLNFPH